MQQDEVDVTTYSGSGPLDVRSTTAKLNVVTYECCPEPYTDITYRLSLAERPRQVQPDKNRQINRVFEGHFWRK